MFANINLMTEDLLLDKNDQQGEEYLYDTEISKLPRTTITKVESGSRNATLQTLMIMAQAMGINVELKLS